MMNSINDLYNIYFNKYSFTITTLSECSRDFESNQYVIYSLASCFKFDDIRDIDYNIDHLKSTDSLYFAFDKGTLLFIEFKNGNYSQTDIAKKMMGSLFIHDHVCKNNCFDINSVPSVFLFVCPRNKEKKNSSHLAAILNRSGIDGSLRNSIATELKKKYEEQMIKHPHILYRYSEIRFVLSKEFETLFSRLHF